MLDIFLEAMVDVGELDEAYIRSGGGWLPS